MNLLVKIIRKFPDREEQDAAVRKLMDDDELYQNYLEHRDEYLEYLDEISAECKKDKKLIESVVMELEERLDRAEDLMNKPGWAALDFAISLRDLNAEFFGGKFDDSKICCYPPMGDIEMASITGLSRGRVVQETKRCKRKLGVVAKRKGLAEEHDSLTPSTIKDSE